MLPFTDRAEAGRFLAAKLRCYEGRHDVLVVGLPCGGIGVAFEVARQLRARLDLMVVRKIGAPGQPELAMGAVASGGIRILDSAIIRLLKLSDCYVSSLIAHEEEQIERREAVLREGISAYDILGQTVILVDDGAATGSTMLAAAEAIRMRSPKEIVIAVPVGSRDACKAFTKLGKCFCLATPDPFFSVAQWYESFPQMTEEEVKALLSRARLEESERGSLRPLRRCDGVSNR